MRCVRITCLITLLAVCAGTSWAQDTSSDQVRNLVQSAFDKSAAYRTTASASASIGKLSDGDSGFSGSPAYDDNLYAVAKALTGPDSAVYLDVVIAELSSEDPAHRGLACELLTGRTDIAAIPALAALLDDKAPASPVPVWSLPQSGPGSLRWCQGTVGQLARMALYGETQMVFRNKQAFDYWWGRNKDYSGKLWYWAARWQDSDSHRFMLLKPSGVSWASDLRPMIRRNFTPDMAELGKLPPDTALKILLLTSSWMAVDAELKAYTSGMPADAGPYPVQFHQNGMNSPGSEAVTAFIKEHNLKSRLIELLNQKNLWPEVNQKDAYYSLVFYIDFRAKSVFAPSDAPAIAAAEKVKTPYPAPVGKLIAMRADVVPAQARKILTDALRAHPEMIGLAATFIARFGTTGEEKALMKTYLASPPDSRSNFASGVRMAAGDKKPISPLFIESVIRTLDSPDDESCYVLLEMARVANITAGKALVSDSEMQDLFIGKITHDAAEAKRAKRPEVFDAVKTKILAGL